VCGCTSGADPACCCCLLCGLQVLSNSSVSSGVGVYWMFYAGGDFEPVSAPEGLPGAAAGAAVEGLRMRPGLAMSQVGASECEGSWLSESVTGWRSRGVQLPSASGCEV
jgi:hypothetical protein